MSGFDVQLRSQELTFPLRQRGAELQANAVAGLGQIPAQAQQLAQQKAESDAKIQAWAIERQLNTQKLKELQALDMAGMSRLTLEEARHRNDLAAEQAEGARIDNEQRRKTLESGAYVDRIKSEAAAHYRTAYGDPEDWFVQNLVPGEAGKPPRAPKNKQELEAFGEQLKKGANFRQRGYEGQARIAGGREILNTLKVRLKGIDDAIEQVRGLYNKTDEDKTQLQELQSERQAVLKEIDEAINELKSIRTGTQATTPAVPQGAVDYGSDEELNNVLKQLQIAPNRRAK